MKKLENNLYDRLKVEHKLRIAQQRELYQHLADAVIKSLETKTNYLELTLSDAYKIELTFGIKVFDVDWLKDAFEEKQYETTES